MNNSNNNSDENNKSTKVDATLIAMNKLIKEEIEIKNKQKLQELIQDEEKEETMVNKNENGNGNNNNNNNSNDNHNNIETSDVTVETALNNLIGNNNALLGDMAIPNTNKLNKLIKNKDNNNNNNNSKNNGNDNLWDSNQINNVLNDKFGVYSNDEQKHKEEYDKIFLSLNNNANKIARDKNNNNFKKTDNNLHSIYNDTSHTNELLNNNIMNNTNVPWMNSNYKDGIPDFQKIMENNTNKIIQAGGLAFGLNVCDMEHENSGSDGSQSDESDEQNGHSM